MTIETYLVYLATVLIFFAHPPGPSQVLILGLTYLVIDGTILLIMGAAAVRLMQLIGGVVERWMGFVSGTGLLIAAALLALRGTPEPAK